MHCASKSAKTPQQNQISSITPCQLSPLLVVFSPYDLKFIFYSSYRQSAPAFAVELHSLSTVPKSLVPYDEKTKTCVSSVINSTPTPSSSSTTLSRVELFLITNYYTASVLLFLAPTTSCRSIAAMPERLQWSRNVPPLQRHLLVLAAPGGGRLLFSLLFLGVQLSVRGVYLRRVHVVRERLLRGSRRRRDRLPFV